MPSIEILVEQPRNPGMDGLGDYSFAVKVSNPPKSDRQPSLWQNRFSEIGGILVHLGESKFKHESKGWFFAYDLLNEENCTRFRFKSEYFPEVITLLTKLLSSSQSHTVHFTSDWQFGPKRPKVVKGSITLEKFFKEHDESGLRFNEWLTIS